MIYVYLGILAFAAVFLSINRNYKREIFKNLQQKEHPLRVLYGPAARICQFFGKIFPSSSTGKVDILLKGLHVKEDVARERFIYSVKKIALCMTIFLAACSGGMLLTLAEKTAGNISSIERADYGKGTSKYQLDMEAEGTLETIDIEISQVRYTDEEADKILNECFEEIRPIVLGTNERFEEITEPLELISDYDSKWGNVDVSWFIDNLKVINYLGEIVNEPDEGGSEVVNLMATLSIDGRSMSFAMPVAVVARTLTEKERLIRRIMEEIEENNSVYEKEVRLPEDIDGNKVQFKEASEKKGFLLPILGFIAVAVVVIGYDRLLEDKVKKRQEEMMSDFAEIVSKLSLLYEAGLSILKSFEKIVADHEKSNKGRERFAYMEMKLALEKIKSGVREGEAYAQFGRRCGLHCFRRLGNILEQNLAKGTKGMKQLLDQEVTEAYEERKRLARKKGEEAGTKMLLPMIMMMAVVIVIVAVPALMSLGI